MKSKPRYRRSIANKWFASGAENYDELIEALLGYAEMLKTCKSKGVILDTSYLCDGLTELYTYDEVVAAELGFEAEPDEEDEMDEAEVGQTMH